LSGSFPFFLYVICDGVCPSVNKSLLNLLTYFDVYRRASQPFGCYQVALFDCKNINVYEECPLSLFTGWRRCLDPATCRQRNRRLRRTS